LYKSAFLPKSFRQSQIVTREKLLKALLYEKCARKMLMKYTPTVHLKIYFSDKLTHLLEPNIDRSMFSKCFVRCSQCVALTSLVNKDLKALLNLSLGFNPIKQLQINDDKIFYNPNRCVFLFLVSSNTLKRYLWESTGPKYLYRLDSNEDPYYLGTLVVKRQNINIESKIIDLSYQSFWLNKTTSY